jgi:hypothetical protein
MANKSDFGRIDGRCQCLEGTVPQPIQYCHKAKCNKIANIFNTRPLHVSFRRKLVAKNIQPWHHLVLRLAHIHLRESNMVVLSFVSLCIIGPRNNSYISYGRRRVRSLKNSWTGVSHPVLRPKLNAYLYVCQDLSFTRKVTNSEINGITSVYYIESYYKAYYKTKRSTQWSKAPCHMQMTGGLHA